MRLHLHLPKTIQESEDGEFDYHIVTMKRANDEPGTISLIIDDFGGDKNSRIERSNKFFETITCNKDFREMIDAVKHLEISFLYLDDWEILFQALQQCGSNLKSVELKECHLTERGALIFGNILKAASSNNKNNNNHIASSETETTKTENLSFPINFLLINIPKGSMAWMFDGLLQNTTITHLEFYGVPLHITIQLILNLLRLKQVVMRGTEEGIIPEKRIDINAHKEPSRIDLETLDIRFNDNEHFPKVVCEGIGCILRRASNLKELIVKNSSQGLPYDFLKDAIHCNKLTIFKSVFNPYIISYLVKGGAHGGKLKQLDLLPRDMSNAEFLLQLIDLTLLDSFTVRSEILIDVVCQQLSENKGPKRLVISLGGRSDLTEFTTGLASNLVGNTKVEHLEISVIPVQLGEDFGPQEQLVDAMSTMPRLRSWKLFAHCFQGHETRMREKVNRQLQSNPNIQEIYLPMELGDDIKEMLLFNKCWRELLRCRDGMSSGIWPRALSQVKTVRLMFRILKEIPDLFRQVSDTASQRDEYQFPSFVVPHHPNCPACHKRRKQDTPT